MKLQNNTDRISVMRWNAVIFRLNQNCFENPLIKRCSSESYLFYFSDYRTLLTSFRSKLWHITCVETRSKPFMNSWRNAKKTENTFTNGFLISANKTKGKNCIPKNSKQVWLNYRLSERLCSTIQSFVGSGKHCWVQFTYTITRWNVLPAKICDRSWNR